MLMNAVVSAEGKLPFCQDTGTATIVAKKGHRVLTDGSDEEALARGVHATYTTDNMRYSQTVALSTYEEKNSGNNLPAQIDIYATTGDEYKFLFIAKGGGSANKTYLFQETKALLNQHSLESFLVEKMKTLGTAACPPYHVAFVVGGTSAEACLKAVKLASAHELDGLPHAGNMQGQAFRDVELEAKLLAAAQKLGFGAQFGGKYFAHDIRVIRLPRHGASCPVGMGVSCSADRNVKAKINRDGIWLEQLEEHPERLLPKGVRVSGADPTRSSWTSTGPCATSWPSCRAILSRRACRSTASSWWPATSRTPSSRSAWTGARACRSTSRTIRSITPARPRPRRACRPARSVLPPPAAWTLTSISSSLWAAPWS